jgi:hypothetical protein
MTVRNIVMVRERVLKRSVDMLEHLRLQEPDVLRLIEKPQVYDLAVELTDTLLAKFGYVSEVTDPRFSKTHRLMSKLVPKSLRGEPKRNGSQNAP